MEEIKEIFIDHIVDPAEAMRSEIDRTALWELADNIKQNGLINPITVRPQKKFCVTYLDCEVERGERCLGHPLGLYEVVAGHRRFSACKICGMVRIKCVVRELSDEKVFEVMAAENLEREDVDVVDEANFILKFIERTKKTIPEVAKALRRSVGYVESRLAIGQMPDYMQSFLKVGEMKLGVALKLVQITDDSTRRMWCEMAVRDGISAAQSDYWLHGWRMSQLPGGVHSETPPDGFTPSVSEPLKFECSVDGKRYLPEDMRTIMVYKENLPFLQNVLREMRKTPVEESA